MRFLICLDCESVSGGSAVSSKPKGWPKLIGASRSGSPELDVELRQNPLWIVRYKAGSCKASLNVLCLYDGKEGLTKGTQELQLAHMGGMCMHQALDLATVRLL